MKGTMSSDARIYPCDEDGWWWRAAHDGVCQVGPGGHEGGLAEAISSLQRCGATSHCWRIEPWQNGYRLVGWYSSADKPSEWCPPPLHELAPAK